MSETATTHEYRRNTDDVVARGPLPRYQALVDKDRLRTDDNQIRVMTRLHEIHQQLHENQPGLIDRIRNRYPAVSGAYLHGGVGRGKTMLMDLLTESLQASGIVVQRVHFHRFMDAMHAEILCQGSRRDPLKQVAAELARKARVLCFDEFHVSDIGDAMILGGLLQALFARGLTLVATSNTAPENLYADGLQRDRFVPAIEAIKARCQVIRLDGEEDYRLRELVRHPVYHHPADQNAEQEMAEEFRALAAGEQISDAPLKIRGRTIQPLRRAGSVSWFDFATLCEGPRASGDYIELARRFGTLIVSGIPQMNDSNNNAARRFVHLVDECYDRAVKLIVSAAVPPTELYTGKQLAASFERTVSRLMEMQSRDYLALAHRP